MGKQDKNLWGVSLDIFCVCRCVCVCVHTCPFWQMSVHICLIICALDMVPLCPQEGISIVRVHTCKYEQFLQQMTDREKNRLVQTCDATSIYHGSQIQLPLSPSFPCDCLLVGSDPCWTVCHSRERLRAHKTTNTAKEFRLKNRIAEDLVFTFNDAHIRELGGSLPSLSPLASAQDYSLASDSQWWMA